MTERFMRLCDMCGGYDNYPRHVVNLPGGSVDAVPSHAFLSSLPDGCSALAIAELMDSTTYVRHINCCAEGGCLICVETLNVVGGVSGDELTAAITSGAVDHLSTDPETGV